MNRIWYAVWLVAIACGPSGSGDDTDTDASALLDGAGANADPMRIPGGGVRSGAIDGVLHVHAIDGDDDGPISGATVYVSGLTGATDGTGLFTFRDDVLSGPQTITVAAPGYATATWIGANGTNVTIPMSVNPTPAIPQARVSGTIAGWDSLDPPSFGEYNLAVVLYSWTDDFGALENQLPQPMSGEELLNICINSPLSNPGCNWEMNTRTGRQVHYAVILRADDGGTLTDPSDDAYTLLGFAMKTGQNMAPGQNLSGQVLQVVDVSGFVNASVGSFPAAPNGAQTSRVAIPFVDIGAEGQLAIPLPTLDPGKSTTKVPALSGQFAGGSYNLVTLALPDSGAPRPFSSNFLRDVDFSGTVSLPPYMAPPGGISASGGTYSFTGTSGASAHVVSFFDGSENIRWAVTILDSTTSFQLPSGVPSPLPSGTVEMRVTAFEVPGFITTNFSLANLGQTMVGVSDDATTFSN